MERTFVKYCDQIKWSISGATGMPTHTIIKIYMSFAVHICSRCHGPPQTIQFYSLIERHLTLQITYCKIRRSSSEFNNRECDVQGIIYQSSNTWHSRHFNSYRQCFNSLFLRLICDDHKSQYRSGNVPRDYSFIRGHIYYPTTSTYFLTVVC